MLTNSDVKTIRSLKEKKYRDELGLFVVEGEKMVREAMESDFDVTAVYRQEEIGEAAMSRISHLSTPSPVLAVVRRPEPEAVAIGNELYLGLDSVRDPGNMGTIIRLADWFGVSTVFCSDDCVDAFNPKLVQATMGAIFRVKIICCKLPEICRRFRDSGLPVYGTFLDGKNIYGRELSPTGLVIMGNESNGISPEVASEVNERLLIPSFNDSKAESLNVAVATAVTLSEFKRRQF